MDPDRSDDFYQMMKPQLCGLLDLLRIGVVFDHAHGDYLFHRDRRQKQDARPHVTN